MTDIRGDVYKCIVCGDYDDLTTACQCEGQMVHRRCLKTYVTVQGQKHCEQCNTYYGYYKLIAFIKMCSLIILFHGTGYPVGLLMNHNSNQVLPEPKPLFIYLTGSGILHFTAGAISTLLIPYRVYENIISRRHCCVQMIMIIIGIVPFMFLATYYHIINMAYS